MKVKTAVENDPHEYKRNLQDQYNFQPTGKHTINLNALHNNILFT